MSTGFLPFFTIAATPSSRCHSLLQCCSRPHSLSSTRVLTSPAASPAASPLIAHRRGATTRSWCCRAPGQTWRGRAWGDRDGNPDGNVRWPRRRLYLKASLSAKKRSGFIFPPWSGCGGLFRVLTGLPAPPPLTVLPASSLSARWRWCLQRRIWTWEELVGLPTSSLSTRAGVRRTSADSTSTAPLLLLTGFLASTSCHLQLKSTRATSSPIAHSSHRWRLSPPEQCQPHLGKLKGRRGEGEWKEIEKRG